MKCINKPIYRTGKGNFRAILKTMHPYYKKNCNPFGQI